MNDLFGRIKLAAPGFEPVFPNISTLIKSESANYEIANRIILTMAEILLNKATQANIKVFLNLPASHNNSGLIRRTFLETAIYIGLDQVTSESGRNGFSLSVRRSTLVKAGFDFSSTSKIDDFGKIVSNDLPQINGLASWGEGPSKDEIYFSLNYNYKLPVKV